MKTTEQINRIKTLKRLIAQMVSEHKSTKVIARMSSNDPKYNYWNTCKAYGTYQEERQRLFVAYTLLHMLRHDITDVKSYAATVLETLTELKQNEYDSWGWPLWLFPTKNDYRHVYSLEDSLTNYFTRLDALVAEQSSSETDNEDGQHE